MWPVVEYIMQDYRKQMRERMMRPVMGVSTRPEARMPLKKETVHMNSETIVFPLNEPSTISTRFEITAGAYLVGHAYLSPGSEIYELKLMMFPRHTYFLCKNFGAEGRYTVFAKQIFDGRENKFLNPIGMGRLSKSGATVIEIYVPTLGRVLSVDLIPSNK